MKRHYLIVDDNRAFAENMAELLAEDDATVTVANSAAEALAAARKIRFDALVSDMRMPVTGGAELVHLVRQFDPGLPAIVITAYTSDSDIEAAREQGLLAVLPKPAPIARLLSLVRLARRDGLIALIEDDHALADNLSEALAERGYSIVRASSVLEAEQLKSARPYMGIVDLKVPGGPDGEAMLRLAARFPALPIVVITAYPDKEPPLRAEGVFPKPFNTHLLLEAVESLYKVRQR